MSQVSSLASWVARTRSLILTSPLLWEFRVRVVLLRWSRRVRQPQDFISGGMRLEARASQMGSFLSVFHRVVPTTGSLRELLPLSTAGVRSHLATALAAPFESRERAAAHWTLGITHSVNLLFCAGWSQHPVSLQRLSSLHPLQEDVVKRRFNAAKHFLAAERPAYHLEDYRVSWGRSGSCGDDVAGESLELQADLVVPAWPAPEVTAKLPL